MRIADVCEFYSPRGGGVRTYIDQKFRIAGQCNVDLHVIAPGPHAHDEVREGGVIHWVAAPFERFDKNYHRFDAAEPVTRWLDALAPDVIEASSPWRGASIVADYVTPAVKSFFMHMDPVAVYPDTFLYPRWPESWINGLAGSLWRRLRRLSAAFDTSIVASHTVAQRLASQGLSRLTVVPLGIERAIFDLAQPDLAIRRSMLAECGIDDPDAPLLVSVSRHHPEKRLGFLMKAVDQLEYPKPVGLVILGDGPWRKQVTAVARRCRHVNLAGRVTDRQTLATMVASADALLHGGAAETFGIAVAEALCAGLPVIVPDRGGANDFAGGLHAEQYRTGDIESCREAIVRMLDPDRLGQRQQAARQISRQILSPAGHLETLVHKYSELIAIKKQNARP
jgi:alpha-1,6-mannosyltransferase